MSHESEHRSSVPPKFWSNQDEFLRKIADSTRGILKGQTNNHFTVTLEAAVSEVAIPYESARPGLSVIISPSNQQAAVFSRSNNVWCESEVGTVRVRYDGVPAGSERYGLVIIG